MTHSSPLVGDCIQRILDSPASASWLFTVPVLDVFEDFSDIPAPENIPVTTDPDNGSIFESSLNMPFINDMDNRSIVEGSLFEKLPLPCFQLALYQIALRPWTVLVKQSCTVNT